MKKPTREKLRKLTHEANEARLNELSPDLLAQARSWAKNLVDEALCEVEEAARKGLNYVVVAWPYMDHHREIQAIKKEIEKAGFTAFTRPSIRAGHTEVLLVW